MAVTVVINARGEKPVLLTSDKQIVLDVLVVWSDSRAQDLTYYIHGSEVMGQDGKPTFSRTINAEGAPRRKATDEELKMIKKLEAGV